MTSKLAQASDDSPSRLERSCSAALLSVIRRKPQSWTTKRYPRGITLRSTIRHQPSAHNYWKQNLLINYMEWRAIWLLKRLVQENGVTSASSAWEVMLSLSSPKVWWCLTLRLCRSNSPITRRRRNKSFTPSKLAICWNLTRINDKLKTSFLLQLSSSSALLMSKWVPLT